MKKSELMKHLGLSSHYFYRLENEGVIPIGDVSSMRIKPEYSPQLVKKIKIDVAAYSKKRQDNLVVTRKNKNIERKKDRKSNAYRVPAGYHAACELCQLFGLQHNSIVQYISAKKIPAQDFVWGRRRLWSDKVWGELLGIMAIMGYEQIKK